MADRLDVHLKLAPSSRDLARRVEALEAKIALLEEHLTNASSYLGSQVAQRRQAQGDSKPAQHR